MSTVADIMVELKKKGNPSRISTFVKHGAPADKMFGVSVADLKVIAKTIKGRQGSAGHGIHREDGSIGSGRAKAKNDQVLMAPTR
ncbi:MAG: DNA alkylation repair protein [Thermoanaerobaculia bacterium]|nr:DNA alkylation repair protein [Thermoanaerobaculia bacterium]